MLNLLGLLLAHDGQPIGPHDLLAAWQPDPLIALALAVAGFTYARGRRRAEPGARRRFYAGLAVVAVALLSPIEAMSASLASAHMVQHLLLSSVAAPLLVAARPYVTLLRGSPSFVRKANRRLQSKVGPRGRRRVGQALPAVAWLGAVGNLWLWHSRALYDLAVANDIAHALEHVAFLGSGLLFWSVILHAGRTRQVSVISAALLLFTAGLSGTLLAALLTFSRRPWYDSYLATTEPWGLDPLSDQQLAGALLWFPPALLYTTAALWLLMRHLATPERPDDRVVGLGAYSGPPSTSTTS